MSTSTESEPKLSPEAAARLSEVYKQEYAFASSYYPTIEDTPTCLDLMYERMECTIRFRRFAGGFYVLGHPESCEPQDKAYKTCRSDWTKLSGEPEKRRDAWVRHRAEQATTLRLGPSSEDVWKTRKEPLKDFPPRLDDASMNAFRKYMMGLSEDPSKIE